MERWFPDRQPFCADAPLFGYPLLPLLASPAFFNPLLRAAADEKSSAFASSSQARHADAKSGCTAKGLITQEGATAGDRLAGGSALEVDER